MNTKAVAWARNQQTGSAITTLVLLQLALRVDSDFACLLSVRTLARATSSGQSTVRRALKALEYHGYVTRDYQFDESGSQRSSRYLLNRPGALAPIIFPLPLRAGTLSIWYSPLIWAGRVAEREGGAAVIDTPGSRIGMGFCNTNQ